MRWVMVMAFVLLSSCLTAGVPQPGYLAQQVSMDACEGGCEQERNECMTDMSQFWEQCEVGYDQCVEYCY